MNSITEHIPSTVLASSRCSKLCQQHQPARTRPGSSEPGTNHAPELKIDRINLRRALAARNVVSSFRRGIASPDGKVTIHAIYISIE